MAEKLSKGIPIVADQKVLRDLMQQTLSEQYHRAAEAIEYRDTGDLIHIARKFQRRIKSELEQYSIELLPEEQ